ncbi:MAG: amidohydrolase family protein [Alphaproteobacteria bacterium]|nr:amidohydrolase family protein [Alphaproteobacteria bacterium]
MLIADSQVHLWTFRGDGNPWHRMVDQYTAPELVAEMDEAGVDRAVVVPPMWMGNDNSQACAAAAAYPDRLAVLGRLDLFDPSGAEKLADWTDQPGMLGLRFTMGKPEEQELLKSGGLDWLWSAAEKNGLPVMFMLAGSAPEAGKIAAAHPGLKITVDHLDLPGRTVDDEAFANLQNLLDLAKYENISVKACTIAAYSSQDYPWPNTHEPLKRVVDAFGPSRVFWGSDLTRLPCSYRECVTQFTEELDWLTGDDLELVMGRALCDWIGWDY